MAYKWVGKDGKAYDNAFDKEKADKLWDQQERLIQATKGQAQQAAEAAKAQAKALEDMAWQQEVAAVEAQNRVIRAEREEAKRKLQEYEEEQQKIRNENINKLNGIGLNGEKWMNLLEDTYKKPPITEKLQEWKERGGLPSLEEWKEERQYNRNNYKNIHVDNRQEQYRYKEFELPKICNTFNKLIIISIMVDMVTGFGALMNLINPAPFAAWCFPVLIISIIFGIVIYFVKNSIKGSAYSKWKKEDKYREENFNKIENEIEKEREKYTDSDYERYVKDFENDYNKLQEYINNIGKFEENRVKEWNQELEDVLEEIGYGLREDLYPENSTQGKRNNKNDDLMKKYGLKNEE